MAHAAKGAKKGNKGGTDVFGKYDANKNGVLDADEITALKKDFSAGDAELKKLDINADGKLDDGEIASIHATKAKKKKNT